MTDATTTNAIDRLAEAAAQARAEIRRAARRVWFAGLGVSAVAVEQARAAFETFERKGQDVEPTVMDPFRRAGEAANRAAQRAGASVQGVRATAANMGKRLGIVDVAEEVRRAVDDALPGALQRLDLPTRSDLQKLADRIEELAARPGQPRQN